MNKYEGFMLLRFPQTIEGQWLKCTDFCAVMMEEFPELSLRKGCVWSHENIDNNHPKYPAQYTHVWLVDPSGNIIDPSARQFDLLGKLEYDEWETMPEAKCTGCGQWHWKQTIDCGECKWSEKDVTAILTDSS